MKPSNIKGTLTVRPQGAELLHNRDLFHKMDPYAICEIGGQKNQTSVAKRQGKTPKWNDSLTFRVMGDQTLKLSLYDKDTFKDTFIGDCLIPLAAAYQAHPHSEWYAGF